MAEQKSRTEYSAVNTSVAMICRVAAIFAGFFNRVAFTHSLSADYVGINGLFTDILNVLSLSELGISTAISFALYKPIAEGDIEKQKSLMALFKKLYRWVALTVFALGLLVIPFMGFIIQDDIGVKNITLIYLLYLINTCLSYLLVYKKTLIDAHQLGYISTAIQTSSWIVQSIFQMLVLILTGNFYLYLVIWMLSTIVSNVLISKKADKLYPFVKEKAVFIPEKEKKDVLKNIRAMMFHKVGNVLINNTDNILLSGIVSVIAAGMYSNYWLVIGSVDQLLGQVFTGISASVGNLGVSCDKIRVKKIFEASFFLGQWMFGFAAITFFELLNPFVGFSFGETYVFPASVTLILCINFYVRGMRQATLVFRDSMGLFVYDKYKAIPEVLINLTVSIILGMKIGTLGIFIGTLVSTVLTSLWIEPFVFYKYKLESKVRFYFLRYGIYSLVTFGLLYLVDFLCKKVTVAGFGGIIVKLLICIFVVNIAYFAVYFNTPEFKLLLRKFKDLSKKKKAKFEDEVLTQKDIIFLDALRKAILSEKFEEPLGNLEEKELLSKSIECGLTAFVSDIFTSDGEAFKRFSVKTEKNSEVLTKLAYDIQDTLAENNIISFIYKGPMLAGYYPVPSHRSFGDVDIVVKKENLAGTVNLLCKFGFVKNEKQYWNHHIVLNYCGIKTEIHTDFTEAFACREINEPADDLLKEEFKMAEDEHNLRPHFSEYATLVSTYLHMLEHFLSAGMGIKFLVDFTLLLNNGLEEKTKERFKEFVSLSKTEGFAECVLNTCVNYLGLNKEYENYIFANVRLSQEAFLKDVLDSESFGRQDKARISTVTDVSLKGYLSEFHHQMKLKYKEQSKYVILWPVLWVMTLVTFVANNKTRKTSVASVLKVAGERGRMINKMDLWK